MISLEQIETELKEAMKAKNQVVVDTLRGLKVRIQNEKISKMRELTPEDIVSLVKSEIKRRKEAAESFMAGDRKEMGEKELAEAAILEKYMPSQLTEQEISQIIDSIIAEHNFTAADFGKAMGQLKSRVGQSADGSLMAKLLKEKLK
jgi:uncharacterized protein YqeY